ncbi:hypothetical protein BpHYR1_043848 [Brachionus plicatilis]|uniref:Uncharacterized protein n=1 Tax=Brachionus plicatilis TaxID=10195 RepID=A0A3M7PUU8_BRAPC|nr:hypothetical protein BpHYR1_043848 [Brachionus plicatilis]
MVGKLDKIFGKNEEIGVKAESNFVVRPLRSFSYNPAAKKINIQPFNSKSYNDLELQITKKMRSSPRTKN